jgi:hypothetical protein
MRLNLEGVDGSRANQPFWGLGGGCYDMWLQPWLDVVGDRFRVEFFEALTHDPCARVQQLTQWLDIDSAPCAGFRYDVENRTVQYKNKQLQRAALFINRRTERFFTEHPALKRALRNTYYRINSDREEERLDASTRALLEDFYAPHNKRLAAQLSAAGVDDVPEWVSSAYARQ